MSRNTEEWVDVLPALHLARAVPVVELTVASTRDQHRPRRGVVCLVLRGQLRDGGEGAEVAWDDGEHLTDGCSDDSVHLRIDLDDPAGFAYALRHLFGLGAAEGWYQRLPAPMSSADQRDYTLALLTGQEEVTDEHRLAVARALLEVIGG